MVKPVCIVRDNLLERKEYTPYCGNEAHIGLERTRFDGEQFTCSCGWRSAFEPEFIQAYKTKWKL